MLKRRKILVVFGTRPEAIKMAPLVKGLKACEERFETKVCVTAQHREMLDQVLMTFNIKPDVDLDIMRPDQDLFDVTSSILLGLRRVFRDEKPDIVLVHGDTTTALACAMAAFYNGIPVGHVEAGLRTRDISTPFPEEFNRQVVSKIAKWHFAPTEISRLNLLAEGHSGTDVIVTGNTVIDALNLVLDGIEKDPLRKINLDNLLNEALDFNWATTRFILITGHRRENFGDGFVQICNAVKLLSENNPSICFVFSVHRNPQVQNPVYSLLGNLPNVFLVEPLEYEPFLYLLQHCFLILTDSGGIQEEAPSLGKPVLLMRDETERPEAVTAGTVKLVGAKSEKIVQAVEQLILDECSYNEMVASTNPYGDGRSTNRIINFLTQTLTERNED